MMDAPMNFYNIAKRRGFFESLKILAKYKEEGLIQATFFKDLEEIGSYYNAFLRVKPFLVKKKLIAYKLNQENDMVIHITEKGIEVVNKLREIEEML
jgi:hypothetical protein